MSTSFAFVPPASESSNIIVARVAGLAIDMSSDPVMLCILAGVNHAQAVMSSGARKVVESQEVDDVTLCLLIIPPASSVRTSVVAAAVPRRQTLMTARTGNTSSTTTLRRRTTALRLRSELGEMRSTHKWGHVN